MQSVHRAHTGGHDRPGAIILHSRVFVRGSGEALHCDGQKLRSVAVPGVGQRIYGISYRYNGDIWFATVGQTQTGKCPNWKGRKRTEEMINIEDPNLVLAIFPFASHDLCWEHPPLV
jgi:hypothetical protein